MTDSDADEYVYYGTPLQQEQSCSYHAARSAPLDFAKAVALPVHQQEVRDAQGRQRLHGAFTGGFSAGYFNSVGSEVLLHLQQVSNARFKFSSHSTTAMRRAIPRTVLWGDL
jgi:hypothetical protein